MSQILARRARIAALTRHGRPADDPELVTERQALKAERLAEQIERDVSTWPPLTDADRVELARLLSPSPARERGSAA